MPGTPLPTQPAGTYNLAQLEALWIGAGGKVSQAPIMAAIAMAESGGNPKAKNASGASGLWQIMMPVNAGDVPGGAGNVFDPQANAKAAVKILNSQGLGAWTTYTTGAYTQFLKQAKDAMSVVDTGHSTLDNVLNAPANAVNAVTQPITSTADAIGSIVGFVTNLQNWIRIGEAVAAFVLLAMGLRSLTGTTTTPATVVTGAAKTAAKVA